MLAYYLRIGVRNLRRNPLLTLLLLLTLAVGVAASMASYTILHGMSGDPIPSKSERLLSVALDNRPLQQSDDGDPPPNQSTYLDATQLKRGGAGIRQTAIYGLNQAVRGQREDIPPYFADGLAVHADFFPMLELRFLEGGPWSAGDDDSGATVAVVARALAERVFGSVAEAMGQDVRLGDARFRVVGVVEDWQPLPRYYRVAGGSGQELFFLPFGTAIARTMDPQGSVNCSGEGAEPGFDGLMRSECVWISYWVELASATDAPAFRDGLAAYVAEQRRTGRFPRADGADVAHAYDVMAWLAFLQVVGNDTRLQVWLAFGFLLVCLVNTVGLMLAKFGARAGEVGVRRALGAPRHEVFRQFLVEAGVIGVVGGLLGVLLTLGSLWLMASQSPQIAAYARMDGQMLAATLALSLIAALAAGLLPTWRACQVRPAVQLKSQ